MREKIPKTKHIILSEGNAVYCIAEIKQLQAELDKLKEDEAGWLATYNAIKKANAELCMERGQLQAELKALKKDGLKGNIPLAVLDQIVRMQEELDKHRWIPVGEGPPEERNDDVPFRSEDVFVTNGKWARRAYWMTRQKYWNFYLCGEPCPVTHWKSFHLPESE